jgi:transglutaminase-like putative cysteine protease
MRIRHFLFGIGAVCALAWAGAAVAASTPAWMRAQVNAQLPAHDDETNAIVLFSETILTVQGPGKIKQLDRKVYRILRREGEQYGIVRADFTDQSRVTAMRGWSIPADGKDYAVGDRDAVESGYAGVDGGELISDLRTRLLRIPAATPGSIIGYEVERDLRPYAMTDEWVFQDTVPVREARYSVLLPAGWSYKAFWLNHQETAPVASTGNQWNWTVDNIKPIKPEAAMPPWQGVAGRMVLSLQPPGGQQRGFQNWQEVGSWYLGLTDGRRDPSTQIKQKVQELTASLPTPMEKMRALASFAQKDIRYVGIQLGIGGVQPHPAAEVFANRYGDCKDKVTLLSSMLKEIGIESHYVIINTQRGAVTANTPPNMGFNHAIIAIQLPANVETAKLPGFAAHKKLGALLFFDPTEPLVPLGRLPGALQANYGMLVTADGGELLLLPQAPTDASGVKRTAKLTLDESGTLRGDVVEVWAGDMAATQRYRLRSATKDVDQIKPVESMLAHSLANFEILKASVRALSQVDRPLEWNYSLEAERYAKAAGDLLIVRPRVIGSKSSALLEAKESRRYPIEFEAPTRDTDVFEISIPAGFAVEELPPPVKQDLGFVSYQSNTEVVGSTLRYSRTFEVKQLSVPVAQADELKMFYRQIEHDERTSVVLVRTAAH